MTNSNRTSNIAIVVALIGTSISSNKGNQVNDAVEKA